MTTLWRFIQLFVFVYVVYRVDASPKIIEAASKANTPHVRPSDLKMESRPAVQHGNVSVTFGVLRNTGRVALKCIVDEDRLIKEMNALAAARGLTNVIQLYGIILLKQSGACLVEERADRILIQRLLASVPMDPMKEILPALTAVAGAMSGMHQRGFCDIDVTPWNLVWFANPERWKVIDLDRWHHFGEEVRTWDMHTLDSFAKLPAVANLTAHQYRWLIPPEGFRKALGMQKSLKASSAMDVWMLGVLLHDMLYAPLLKGMPPKKAVQFLAGRKQLAVPPPGMNTRGPMWMQALLKAALQKDPAQRISMARFRAFLQVGHRMT